jgi:hypothetical protein
MSYKSKLEKEVRNTIRNNRWLIISTASLNSVPQSSVVVYASDGYVIYVLTGENTKKIMNMKQNNIVSITIPFYKNIIHRLIKVAPPAAISFRAKTEILDYSDIEAANLYKKALNFDLPEEVKEDSVWIKITPGQRASCYGVGIGLLELRDPSKAHKVIKLTKS